MQAVAISLADPCRHAMGPNFIQFHGGIQEMCPKYRISTPANDHVLEAYFNNAWAHTLQLSLSRTKI